MDDCSAHGPIPLSLDEAVARVAQGYGAVTGTEEVPLRQALGRVLAEEVVAPVNVPPADVSAMMRTIKFNIDSETVFDVEGGMTRSLEDRSSLSVALPGASLSKHDTKVVTVTPLP